MRARGRTLTRQARLIIWVVAVAITVAMSAIGCALMKPAVTSRGIEKFAGTWDWGSPRRSAFVPFLKISERDSVLVIETKHYMHSYFVADTKDISVDGNHLEFTYWYAPLCRWATCSLDLASDRMNGQCEGETRAAQWGQVPTYLWRQNSAEPRN
jgi:hypothetical protein